MATDKEVKDILNKTAEEACNSIKKLCDALCIEHNSNYDFEDEEFKDVVKNTQDGLCDAIRRLKGSAIAYCENYNALLMATKTFCVLANGLQDDVDVDRIINGGEE